MHVIVNNVTLISIYESQTFPFDSFINFFLFIHFTLLFQSSLLFPSHPIPSHLFPPPFLRPFGNPYDFPTPTSPSHNH